MPSAVELFADLPPVESLVLRDAQCICQNITVDSLQTLHPYLPAERARQTLQALAQKKILEFVSSDAYRYTTHTLEQVQETERAILAFAQKVGALSNEQAERLAVLTTALVDMISYGPNRVPTPIFALVNRNLTPSEHPHGQIQQRLISLLAYLDDAHIAAWRSEGYSPAAIRLATYLFMRPQPLSLADLVGWPLFYDEGYVRAGLDELLKEANVEAADGSYKLTEKGLARREKVETLTDDTFKAPFEQRISENGRRQWTSLMTLLGEGGKIAAHPGSGLTTISVPAPTKPEAAPTTIPPDPANKS